MSMYNMLFGTNPASDWLLATLNLTRQSVPRFRDCFLSDGKIAVYTRMGGGNRGHWEFSYKDNDPGPDCPCPGCRAEYVLGTHPEYLDDSDDDFDSTYATYYFNVPDRFKSAIQHLESGEFNPDDRWKAKLEEIKTWTPEQIPEGMRRLLEEIGRLLEEQK